MKRAATIDLELSTVDSRLSTGPEGAAVFDFLPRMLHGLRTMPAEEDRTRLICQIARLLRDGAIPDEARAAGLTLIGWLARRMPGEGPSTDGVEEMRRRCALK